MTVSWGITRQVSGSSVIVGTATVVQVHNGGSEITLRMHEEEKRYQVPHDLWDLVKYLAKGVQICVTISQDVVIKIEEQQFCK